MSRIARIMAAAIALVALIGFAVQFHASLVRLGSATETTWVVLRYFTIIANLLVAAVFTGIAAGRASFAAPSLLGGVTLAILLVGVVYGLLLDGLLELSAGDNFADLLLHKVTPVLVPLWWVTFAPKGLLNGHDPWRWTILPVIYLAYALARGALEGVYAYPFMDVPKIGWLRTEANALLLGVGFLAAAYAFVWLDKLIGRRAEPATP
jgi:hypothetical protein